MLMTGLSRSIFAVGLVVGATATAQAMSPADASHVECLGQEKLTAYLDKAWDEAQIAAGALENGNSVSLYASREGSWTLVEHHTNGQSCVHASGTGMKVEQIKQTKRTPAS